MSKGKAVLNRYNTILIVRKEKTNENNHRRGNRSDRI